MSGSPKTTTKRLPPRPSRDPYRFSDEDLASDHDFQQALVRLSATRDTRVLGTKVEVKSPLGPFVIPCLFQHGRVSEILVSQPDPWDAATVKSFFSYVCRVRTTNEYVGMPIRHAQERNIPAEAMFLSESSPAALLAVDARVFYKTGSAEDEANFSARAEDFSKILKHHADFDVGFEPGMLPHLDAMIQNWYFEAGHDHPCLGALKNMLGFFYGEIFVRNHLGHWLARKSDGGVTAIWIDTEHCRYNVIGKVWKAFKYGTEEESLEQMFHTAVQEVIGGATA